jgi:ribonuclease HI
VSQQPDPLESSVSAIIAAIQQLTPAQRRQLQRRLRVSGLFVPEAAVTDQQRLKVAPALGSSHPQPISSPPSLAQPTYPPALAGEPEVSAPPSHFVRLTPAEAGANPRSPVSGRVVVHPLASEPPPPDPHVMLPLPGQAPEQPISIIFDGGSKGNPGQGYGSYALRWPGVQQQIVKLRFGDRTTNNEAEYDTLIAALEGVLKRLQDNGAAPATAKLDIRGDSLLVINQVLGKWQVKEEHLQQRCERVRKLLQNFGVWRLTHHDRANSVEVLGH